LMTAASPWNGPQRRDLRANSQVEKGPKCFRGQRHRVHEPPEEHHASADRYYAGMVELRGPGQRAKWNQDAGILDRVLVPSAL
jgi:hypothetical protein